MNVARTPGRDASVVATASTWSQVKRPIQLTRDSSSVPIYNVLMNILLLADFIISISLSWKIVGEGRTSIRSPREPKHGCDEERLAARDLNAG